MIQLGAEWEVSCDYQLMCHKEDSMLVVRFSAMLVVFKIEFALYNSTSEQSNSEEHYPLAMYEF